MNDLFRVLRCMGASLCLALAACGGGGDGDAAGSGAPAAGTVVGAAGGTVAGPNGASVLIPPGALASDTTIRIEQTSTGAPALPGGFSVSGQTFAFTPHGSTFAVPVTMTLPFDPALVPAGSRPTLYKTNAQNQWEQVTGVTVGGAEPALVGSTSRISTECRIEGNRAAGGKRSVEHALRHRRSALHVEIAA